MADEMPPPPEVPGQPDRRRPAPTIDLQATEIASEPVAGAGPEATSFPLDEPSAPEQPEQETAPKMPPPSAAHRSLSGLAAAVSWPLVGAGLGGALLTLGIVWVVALAGNDSGATEARIAQLEQQVADLAGHAPTIAANSAAAGDLANRLQKLETQLAQATQAAQAARAPAAGPALANRISALETQIKSLGETVGTLGQRSESSAAANAAALSELTQKLARADTAGAQSDEKSNAAVDANTALIAALANRLDALEGSAKTTETALAAELAKHGAEIADDRSVRTAVIAAALAAAVERGRPFAAELQAAQAQAADPDMLAPLAPFAAAGVPNPNALVRELSSLEPALLQAAETKPPESGFLEKLEAHAERLVRIRPIEEVTGDEPTAVIARVEIKAARGDVPGALMELGKLSPPLRAPAQAWIDKAQGRAAALAASRRFAADALAALVKPSP
ncbi:MAG TPA: hypothetical protein VGI22_12240 [Xanthobacteraceae bacterium]|jgi:hypothetical protein